MRILVLLLTVNARLLAGSAHAGSASAADQFFEALKGMCGERFTGQSVFPEDPGPDWKGQTLVAHIEICEPDRLLIPFQVGENRSRTWIIRRVPTGLELKHDHRHADGSPDEVTMYGGTTAEAGTATRQSFPADAYTAELIPEAATNVWTLILSDDNNSLTYDLQRHGQPRFRAELTRVEQE